MFWDWLCGTDQDFWTEVAEKTEEAAEALAEVVAENALVAGGN
jgi:hypothetical protein